MAWGFDRSEHGLLVGLVVGLGLVAVAGLIVPRRDDVTARMSATLIGVAYIGVPLGTLVLARELPHGGGVVAIILVGTWVFDTLAYLGGRAWGRTPIAPRTSPNKTIEGTIVGAIGGTFAVWMAGLYMDWIAGWQALLLGAVICAAAYTGDLFESMIKRDAGAKDSGRLLLAHGGVLDRFDALLFSAVAGYLVTVALVF
jgi:phosphatidate cytidylyltransferase